MRSAPIIQLVCLVLIVAPLRAGDARDDQVNAAATQAFETLRREVREVLVAKDLTVGALIDQCQGSDQLDAALHGADQIGGARWLDSQTVQVRLEIGGPAVARAIDQIAEKNSALLPLPLHVLRDRMKAGLSRRTYSATGTSIAPGAVGRLRPDPSQIAWQSVADADRQSAIEAARHNAVERVIDSLRTAEWDYGKRRLADAMALPAVVGPMRDWLYARPITSVEFHDDLEVRVSLAASHADLWPALSNVLSKQSVAPVPHNGKEWDALRHQVKLALVPATGIAVAHGAAPAAVGGMPPAIVPRDPPPWASMIAEAEGDSARAGDQLKTARVAQTIAMARLRERIDALSFDATTLGEAARKDPRIEQALNRGLAQARISRVDYDSPARGSARVKMTLNLEIVWRELLK
jgi:hypothetical protein